MSSYSTQLLKQNKIEKQNKKNIKKLKIKRRMTAGVLKQDPNIYILPSTGQENSIAQPKTISDLAFHLIFHWFLQFNCFLSVVLWHNERDYPENFETVFVLTNCILLNLLYV